MFKIPDWEDDVPKSSANFTKKFKRKSDAVQKSPTTNTKSKKEQKGKLIKTKSPINHLKNDRIEKLKKKNVQKHNPRIQNKSFNFTTVNDREAFVKKDIKFAMQKGSLLKHHKNEKNNEMMNKRLQNKLTKANKNTSKNTTSDSFKNKNIPKVNNIKNISKVSKTVKTKISKVNENKEDNDSLNINFLGTNNPKRSKRKRRLTETDNLDIQNFDSNKLDKVVINAKKKKLNESLKNDDNEDVLSIEADYKPQVNRKKEIFKKLLEVNNKRNHIEVKGNKLRDRMLDRLKAAQFRYLNEKLYTSSGTDAQQLFQSDPAAFQTYHQGYQQQVKKWPVNPLDVIVKKIAKMPKTSTIADMGCGEAALSKRIPHRVRSFDLVASAPGVEACDMAHTPLLSESMDVAVYCLALMGTDLTQYLVEANRVLKIGGQLLIAEVESRFEDVDAFAKEVQRLGFKMKKLDKSHKVFFFLEFTKTGDPPAKKSKLPSLSLRPCLYKRR